MKAPSVSLLLGVCVLLLSALAVSAVSLQVSPNLQQIFKKYASSVSLSCVDDDGQTADGWKSDEVSISISDRSVILEIPALPVRAGSNVTLRCRNHRGSTVEAYFFINGSHVGPEHQSELIITNVQKSDEGVYSCSVGVDKESLKSFLRVREPAATSSFSPPPPFLPPCLLLLLLLFPLCLY
ncbi:uncharacterized protein LOC106097534 isoform X2 [Oreochromis niloticus]|uniref:uncharacterized protein LOC106097534 isoform X2 n=1 Tax=Oreochromis niloticus TaxID=8128 RepID=UPI000905624A|nr:uncharacterized protein LOC106097534 isoform X2 [Oreochromis niloticus]CAI5656973.1 unnamed protein product [Mustela putorius furo]